MVRLKFARALLAGAVPALLAGAFPAAAAGASLEVVGRDALNSRGMNAGLAVAAPCAYVGSRTDAAPLVLDIANPAAPRAVGQLPAHAGSTPRELRAAAGNHELLVLSYDLRGGPNQIDLYRWGDDCRTPSPAGSYSFGSRKPHEMYLWQDPKNRSRLLLFVTMFGAGGDGLDILDVSDPAAPRRLGGWAVPSGYGSPPVHSISLAPDGAVAYVSLWTGGLIVADVSDFASGKAQPALRPLTPPPAVFRTPPGNVHSAVPLAGGTMVLTTDERYPTPFGAGCPFGTAHVVDVSNPAAPRSVAALSVPENDPAACRAAPSGTWTSHNPTVTAHLALVSWHSAGLQVFSLDDPARPSRLAELRPSGVSPKLRDLELGTTDAMTWSYPVLSGGLVYVVDINQGLLVLRYHGLHEEEVSGTGFAEGNSNLDAATAAGSPSAAASASAGTATPGSTPAAPSAAAPQPVPLLAAAGLVMLASGGALAIRWRRRR